MAKNEKPGTSRKAPGAIASTQSLATATATALERLKHQTFYGREKENLVLHGIDQPNLWHGNTLSNAPTYDALFEGAPPTFDVILTTRPSAARRARTRRRITASRPAPRRSCSCSTSWPS